jgi:ABC-2 type transport system permease protein
MRRINALKKYLILTEQAIQGAMAYRVTFFISLLGGMIQVLILYYIWKTVYWKQEDIQGFTFVQMVTYIFITYAIKNLYSFYTEVGISSKIRDGSVAMELIKPLNYQFARFFESLGSVVVEGILIGLFVLGIGFGIFRISGPPTVSAGVAFTVSSALSLLVNFAISYILGLFSFWTTSVFGIVNSKRFILDFFSGGLVPLAFFPGWLKNVAVILPFQAIVHIPVSIYLGRIRDGAIYYALLHQVAWVVILWGIGHVLWCQATKRITIHGG